MHRSLFLSLQFTAHSVLCLFSHSPPILTTLCWARQIKWNSLCDLVWNSLPTCCLSCSWTKQQCPLFQCVTVMIFPFTHTHSYFSFQQYFLFFSGTQGNVKMPRLSRRIWMKNWISLEVNMKRKVPVDEMHYLVWRKCINVSTMVRLHLLENMNVLSRFCVHLSTRDVVHIWFDGGPKRKVRGSPTVTLSGD